MKTVILINKNNIKTIALQIYYYQERDKKKLARLPIEKKIEILVELQKIAVSALPKSKQHKARKMIWKLT
ncbi:MAG: hypothetical protein KGZ58_04450 [Ignavibacteriales bacterium]|nr:hypothetical protein [Ignavibacteriales bacterium]